MSPESVLEGVAALVAEALGAGAEALVADAILRHAGNMTGADQGALGLVREGEVITVAAILPPRQPLGSHFPVGFGVAGWVAATGRAAEIQDVREDRRYVVLPYPEVRSFVGVPLQIGDDMLGVLSLGAWRPAAFGPGTAEELAPFARIAALLLRRAREDEQRQARFNALEREAHEGLAESLHELKAPLHAASGFLELVVDEQTGPLNDLQKDFLQTARAECARLKDAITSLMEVSSSASRRPLALARIEPGQLVSEVVQRMRGHALARNLQLVIDADPTADTLEGDPAALSQVLTNLLQNAFRVAPVGSQVVVRALRADGWTHFVVDDEGPGVPDGELTSIFERFVQAEPGRREPGQVGLGLAISRRIVEAHNGRIWAENRDNGGARFCFAVPRAAAESRFADTGPSQSPLEELRSASRSWADGAVGRSARAA